MTIDTCDDGAAGAARRPGRGGARIDPDLPRHPASAQRGAGRRDRGRGARRGRRAGDHRGCSTAGSRSASAGPSSSSWRRPDAVKCSTRDLPRVLAGRAARRDDHRRDDLRRRARRHRGHGDRRPRRRAPGRRAQHGRLGRSRGAGAHPRGRRVQRHQVDPRRAAHAGAPGDPRRADRRLSLRRAAELLQRRERPRGAHGREPRRPLPPDRDPRGPRSAGRDRRGAAAAAAARDGQGAGRPAWWATRARLRAAPASAAPAETPFMLRHMAERSGGATVEVNCALALANADLAGRLAASLAGRAPSVSVRKRLDVSAIIERVLRPLVEDDVPACSPSRKVVARLWWSRSAPPTATTASPSCASRATRPRRRRAPGDALARLDQERFALRPAEQHAAGPRGAPSLPSCAAAPSRSRCPSWSCRRRTGRPSGAWSGRDRPVSRADQRAPPSAAARGEPALRAARPRRADRRPGPPAELHRRRSELEGELSALFLSSAEVYLARMGRRCGPARRGPRPSMRSRARAPISARAGLPRWPARPSSAARPPPSSRRSGAPSTRCARSSPSATGPAATSRLRWRSGPAGRSGGRRRSARYHRQLP